ncbi:MAG TPA: protein kinase [Verrucomicrobiota bacterium]|nr:protein kinase [Verrucomicrobiota bacterium]
MPPSHCPGCGAEVPPEAPQGLCPRCLLAGVAQATESAPTVRSPDGPPSIEVVRGAFPQLDILECIGQGGMGVVYKARQPKLERLVALKLLPQRLAGDAAFRERFTREGRLLARLNHPSIVTVYDFGEAGGFFYLLMEYVDGANLRQAMQAGRFTPAQALAIVPKICEALQFAHGEGILHRDIKPENILLDTKGRVKIADFGIAKLMGERPSGGTLTATGAAMGTPQYMAPEQLEHPQDVDHRADIYSLGVVFYEMLTGELPLGRFAPPSAKTPVDTRVDDVVFRTLEKERERRFQSADAVKTEIEGITSGGATPDTSLAGAAASSKATHPPIQSGDQAPGVCPSPGAGGRGPDLDARRLEEPGRLTERGEPAPLGGDAVSPLSIRPEHRPLVLMGLAVLLALLMLRLLPLPGLLIGTLSGALRAGIGPALWTALSIAAGGCVVWLAWVNRRRLLEPLGVAPAELEESETVSLWASQRILGTMAVAVLMALAAAVGSQVVLLISALLGFAAHFAWPTVLALAIGGLLAWWLLRNETKWQPCPPVAPKPWQPRVGILFLVLAGVALLPSLIAFEGGVRYWQLDALLGVTGVALLTRSRGWRTAALCVNTFLAVLGAAQIFAALLLIARLRSPVELSPLTASVGVGPALGLAVLQILAFVAGLVVLYRRDVRLSFGLGEAARRSEPVMAGGGAPVGRMCPHAVWSVVLVGLSLLFAVLGLPLLVLMARGLTDSGPGGVGKVALLLQAGLGLLGVGSAIAGTVMGIVSWRRIGRSGGALRGKALAVIGALTWPVLAVVLVPLLAAFIGFFTVRVMEPPRASVPIVSVAGNVQSGVVGNYRIPAGQAAVFEVVTRDAARIVPLPGFAVHALALSEGEAEAELLLESAPPKGNRVGRGPRQLTLICGGRSTAMADLFLPDEASGLTQPSLVGRDLGPDIETLDAALANAERQHLMIRRQLEPDSETIDWFQTSDPGRSPVGLRVRTCAHGLSEVRPGGLDTVGTGTNWMSSAQAAGQPEGG